MFTVTTRDGSEAHLNPGAMAGADVVCCRALVRPEGEDGGRVRRVLETLTPVVNVTGISTDGDFLVLQLRATPLGIPRAFNAARALAAG